MSGLELAMGKPASDSSGVRKDPPFGFDDREESSRNPAHPTDLLGRVDSEVEAPVAQSDHLEDLSCPFQPVPTLSHFVRAVVAGNQNPCR